PERAAIKFDRLLAAAVEEQVGLELHCIFSSSLRLVGYMSTLSTNGWQARWTMSTCVHGNMKRGATTGRPVRSTYRHGDLRRALLEAGIELARGGGPDAG